MFVLFLALNLITLLTVSLSSDEYPATSTYLFLAVVLIDIVGIFLWVVYKRTVIKIRNKS